MIQVLTICKLLNLKWLLVRTIKYFLCFTSWHIFFFFFFYRCNMLDALLLLTNLTGLFHLPGMWFPRRRATISNGRSTRRRTASSGHAATSVRTWRTSTWSQGTWIMWVERSAICSCCCYLKRRTWLALQQKLRSFRRSNGRCSPPLPLFSHGSSSQRRTPTTAWPSRCQGRPPSWRRCSRRHRPLSPRSFQTTWTWGCRSLRMLTVKSRDPALHWWGSEQF